MKHLLLVILFLINSFASKSQSVSAGYSRNFYGNFLSGNYIKEYKTSSINIGIHYLINNKYNPDASRNVTKHRFHAYNTIQHFSPSFQYARRLFLNRIQYNHLYFFINSQFIASGIKEFDVVVLTPFYDSITQKKIYKNVRMNIEDKNITYGLNNSIGLGLKANLTNHIYINFQYGISILTSNYIVGNKRYWSAYDFGTFFQISFGYSFNTKKKDSQLAQVYIKRNG